MKSEMRLFERGLATEKENGQQGGTPDALMEAGDL